MPLQRQPEFQEEEAPYTIDIDRVHRTKLETSPYPYIIVSDFIRPAWKERLMRAYPDIRVSGSLPLSMVSCSEDFSRLIAEMNGGAFRQAIAEKFSVPLENKPTMFTVRGKCRLKDGKVHTDSESKIITVLLYMNAPWQNDNGKLRVLRSRDINDVAAEVPPDIGTLLVFRRNDHSWHGHLPFEGARKVIQMNWMTEQKYVDTEQRRHKWSFMLKIFGNNY